MGTTLSVIILIVLVIAAGLMRDSLRTGAVNRWGKARGFMPVPTAEHDRERLIGWAERFRPDSAAVRDRLGIEVTEKRAVHPLDAELAAVDDYVLVRVPGLIAAGRLDDLLASADRARALFAQAAARMSPTR